MNDGAARDAEAAPRRRSVANRVLLAFAVVLFAFAGVAGWSVLAQRAAAREAELMRSGYLPLNTVLKDAEATQDLWNSQLNHITTARNPADKEEWFRAALSVGRPKQFAAVRAALARALANSEDNGVRDVGRELSREATAIEKYLADDERRLTELFAALDRGDSKRAEALRADLVTRGIQGKRRLRNLSERVQRNVDALLAAARDRERLAIRLLFGLSIVTVLVGVGMALYARRVLAPLATVTERAKAVADGDLTPRPVVASNDEIGELAQTFEAMVLAIGKANANLVASERLATVGKMAAHVTHEIRNPLSSIGLNIELLEEELAGGDEEALGLVKAVQAEVERLTDLSEEYLSVARRQAPRLEEEDVGQIVTEAFEFMRRDLQSHDVKSELHVDDELPPLMIDEAQIKQVIFNLVRNAREVLQAGGSVVLRVQSTGGGAEILVEDDGPGMDDETRERIFEPFFTTKSSGTGLGLAISMQIIEAHGGTIKCEPNEPRGTLFRVVLPKQ